MSDLRKAWRKRLAVTIRRFRRLRGYWPAKWIIAAAKNGIEQAIRQGIPAPPLEN